MNDIFIRLALDAGLLNYVDHETPRRYFISGHAEQEDVEKFAELIVEECRYVMDCNKGSDQNPAWNQALSETSEKIKEHFGVE